MEKRIAKAIHLLQRLGFKCSASASELLEYLCIETRKPDVYSSKEILSNDLLILHELAEITELKKEGLTITKNILLKFPDHAYEAHLKALEIELKAAKLLGNYKWIEKRICDIRGYLKNKQLPPNLWSYCTKLIREYERNR